MFEFLFYLDFFFESKKSPMRHLREDQFERRFESLVHTFSPQPSSDILKVDLARNSRRLINSKCSTEINVSVYFHNFSIFGKHSAVCMLLRWKTFILGNRKFIRLQLVTRLDSARYSLPETGMYALIRGSGLSMAYHHGSKYSNTAGESPNLKTN